MAAISLFNCRRCGVQFEWRRKKPFCPACTIARRNEQNKVKRRHHTTCVNCGKPFMTRREALRRGAYCSRKCANGRDLKLIPCPRCGATFWPWRDGNHARKYCSRKCADEALRKPAPPPWNRRRRCGWCGVEFTAKSKRQIYCCDAHNAIAQSQLRKARLRQLGGDSPSISELFERDNGRCWLCRKRVFMRHKWPDQRTASRDHVIPISKDGRDERSNFRLAHLGCNRRKQAHVLTLF